MQCAQGLAADVFRMLKNPGVSRLIQVAYLQSPNCKNLMYILGSADLAWIPKTSEATTLIGFRTGEGMPFPACL